MTVLEFDDIELVPIIHGRLAFALEVRRRLLSRRYAAIAVELPASLGDAVREAITRLPLVSIVVYRAEPPFLAGGPFYYVPIEPADAVIEALRIAERERIPICWLDAEIDDEERTGPQLPDPHALHTLGLDAYVAACRPALLKHPRTRADATRESHMAARLRGLRESVRGPILVVCGLAHAAVLQQLYSRRTGRLFSDGTPPTWIATYRLPLRMVPVVMSEIPYLVVEYERHRAGFELDDYDAVLALRKLLLKARDILLRRDAGTLERPEPQRLRTMLDFLRKLTLRSGRLLPDSYSLTLAAKGVVGNDYALIVLLLANTYLFNRVPGESGPDDSDDADLDGAAPETDAWDELVEDLLEDAGVEIADFLGSGVPCAAGGQAAVLPPIEMSSPTRAVLDEESVELRNRIPGTKMEVRSLMLERLPDLRRRRAYERAWHPHLQCSWPPEDIVIESFRDYVGRRAMSLARVGVSTTEPFCASILDGIDFRETLRDVVKRRLMVRNEPRVPGAVGALVLIFEEDDFGEKFPWRTTWLAEHENESTLAFYATDFQQNVIGPGIARSHYGGCLLVFPPIRIPDIWEDLRFERARTPSERLLLAGIYWCRDHYVAHVGHKPPRPEIKEEAARRGKHILHLPLGTFSSSTLERLRRVHVLNGRQVRSYAQRFIR
ncbi:MAG: hypothetical protein ACKVX7_13530 [Planctomycetota bacterium]